MLVTGFLGSGKTTLVRQLIDHYAGSQKIAIIQNEYAGVNIDARELKQSGKSFELLEINNGSVFCVCLLGSFVHALSGFIARHQPDLIILEASGLSDPISIGQVISAPALSQLVWLAHIYTIVDALNFRKTLQRVGRNAHQIRVADTLIINKCDLAGESIAGIRTELSRINPYARMIETNFCRIELTAGTPIREFISIAGKQIAPSAGRPDINSVVIKTTKTVSAENLGHFIRKYSLIAYRIKGYVISNEGTMAVQASFTQTEIARVAGYFSTTELVIIGPEIDQKDLQTEFESLCGGH